METASLGDEVAAELVDLSVEERVENPDRDAKSKVRQGTRVVGWVHRRSEAKRQGVKSREKFVSEHDLRLWGAQEKCLDISTVQHVVVSSQILREQERPTSALEDMWFATGANWAETSWAREIP